MTKKSLGQNYLIDHNIAKKINKLISNYNNYNLIEIGPGKGFLTDYLIKNNPKISILIEKDYELYIQLKKKYKKNKSIKIYNEDALKTKILDKIPKPKLIASNLPYNISIKLITNWLINIEDYLGLYLMIQKEVAERFIYKETEKSNRLNLLTYLMSSYKKEFDISPNVFYPKPNVFSSFVSFKPNVKERINIIKFQEFTKKLFFSKRKKIMNNLIKDKFYKEILKNLSNSDVNLSKRPEELKFNEVIKLFKQLT